MKKALYMLAAFSDRDFDWLLNAGRRKTVPIESVLIKQGESADALYLVLDGTLLVTANSDGQTTSEEIARLGPGEIVGEMSFVDARPPSATVRAADIELSA